jgi:hypothetical protein
MATRFLYTKYIGGTLPGTEVRLNERQFQPITNMLQLESPFIPTLLQTGPDLDPEPVRYGTKSFKAAVVHINVTKLKNHSTMLG